MSAAPSLSFLRERTNPRYVLQLEAELRLLLRENDRLRRAAAGRCLACPRLREDLARVMAELAKLRDALALARAGGGGAGLAARAGRGGRAVLDGLIVHPGLRTLEDGGRACCFSPLEWRAFEALLLARGEPVPDVVLVEAIWRDRPRPTGDITHCITQLVFRVRDRTRRALGWPGAWIARIPGEATRLARPREEAKRAAE